MAKKSATMLLLYSICIASNGAWAVDNAPIELRLIVQKELVEKDHSGKEIVRHVQTDTVVPGDTLLYTTEFHNRSQQQADEVQIINPIPQHMTYLSDSAKGATTITFSVDQGKHFDLPEKLTVTDSDGKTRAATSKDFTHIRWTVDSIAVDGRGSVSFKAMLD